MPSKGINGVFKSTVVSMERLLEDKEVSPKLNVSKLLTELKEGSAGGHKHTRLSEL